MMCFQEMKGNNSDQEPNKSINSGTKDEKFQKHRALVLEASCRGQEEKPQINTDRDAEPQITGPCRKPGKSELSSFV